MMLLCYFSLHVACRIPEDKRVSDESTPIHYSLVVCSGDQNSLLDCDMEETADGCTHQQDAAIVCRRGELGMRDRYDYIILE